MADEQLAELLKTQKSLTEWLEDIKHKDVEALRREDNDKRERLRTLNDIIGLPYDKPVQFEAIELDETNPQFAQYLQEHGDELCALRLLPKADGLPKLRMRGKNIREAFQWFKEQNVDSTKYKADFVPHPPDYGWSTIFMVNRHGIQGDIIFGGHHLLTQGFHGSEPPIQFHYDFKSWKLTSKNIEALTHLKKLANHLLVNDPAAQKKINSELNGTFVNNFLEGYFESTDSSVGTWFIDYNRILGKMYDDVAITISDKTTANNADVSGRTGSHGQAEGIVRVVLPTEIDHSFEPGLVLVCTMTTPNHVPLMNKAVAIITDHGGILSHAAIVARELGKPCVVGTGNATEILQNGHRVRVDASSGTVHILN